jgi:hypothetical protein
MTEGVNMDAKFTPGPWRVCDSPSNFQRGKQYIRPANSEALIATVGGEMKQVERWANADLIGAAPELLAALEKCVALLDEEHPGAGDGYWPTIAPVIDEARRVIKKANKLSDKR